MNAVSWFRKPKQPTTGSSEKIYTSPFVINFARNEQMTKLCTFIISRRKQIGSDLTFLAFIRK